MLNYNTIMDHIEWSVWGYIELFQIISTEDTTSDTDRACKVDITSFVSEGYMNI